MKSLGTKGESLAVSFLKKKGYRIISQNYRTPFGEVDIIAEHRGTLIFAEVKTRTSDAFGHPFEAVNYRKKEKLRKLALSYLKHTKANAPVRFDVLSITFENEKGTIEHIIDAFE